MCPGELIAKRLGCKLDIIGNKVAQLAGLLLDDGLGHNYVHCVGLGCHVLAVNLGCHVLAVDLDVARCPVPYPNPNPKPNPNLDVAGCPIPCVLPSCCSARLGQNRPSQLQGGLLEIREGTYEAWE